VSKITSHYVRLVTNLICISLIFLICLDIPTERKALMISTALAIQNATAEAVHDEEVMDMASALYHHRSDMTGDEFAKALFQYSAHLSAMTATLVTHACLTESQIGDMLEAIKEMDALGKDITNGNN